MTATLQMTTLINLLDAFDIPYEVTSNWINDSAQVWYPNKRNPMCDVISHSYSYGGSEGLLEIMGLCPDIDDDDVLGWLTAEDVFERIYSHYTNQPFKSPLDEQIYNL